MMKPKSLRTIAFSVLAIPFICQLLISAVLYSQVKAAEKSVEREISARSYTINIQRLVTAMIEKLLSMRLESQNAGISLFAESRASNVNYGATIRALFNHEALSPAARIRLQKVLDILSEVEHKITKFNFTQLEHAQNLSLEGSLSRVFEGLNFVGNDVASYSRSSSAKNITTLTEVRQYLLVALAVSSLGGIVLAWLIGQLAYGPIKRIIANAHAMTARKSLVAFNSPLKEFVDINDALVKIAATLNEASSRQRNLFSLSPAFLLEVASNATILRSNGTAEDWLNQTSDKLKGQNFFRLLEKCDDDIIDVVKNSFEAARETRMRKVFQLSTKGAAALSGDKSIAIPAETQWTVTWEEQSDIYFCVATDITDSASVEKMRDQISRYLTIELGVPLKTINSLILQAKQIVLAQGEDESGATTKQLAVISANLTRLTSLLNQLDQSTDLNNLSAAAAQGICSNKTVVARSVDAVRSLAQGKNVQIVSKVDWAMVRISESELERVLINLMSNAIKFTPPDSRVEVISKEASRGLESSRAMTVFKVIDQGSGIPENARQSIFGAYTQLKNSGTYGTTHTASTGLGLNVCKTIVERSGGRIWVENNAGGGAAFIFEIPSPSAGGQARLID